MTQAENPHGQIVLGDFDRMQQVLWNLFFNAVKFTPRGGRVTIWSDREAMSAQAGAAEPESRRLDGLSVLVVDDDPDVRDALKGVLERCGAAVRAAAAVDEPMKAVREAVPDVLVSDLGMPGDDGYELIRQVRMLSSEAGGTLPAVAVSAYARESDLRKALAAGFRVHLSKPVTPVELVDQVARAAGRAGA